MSPRLTRFAPLAGVLFAVLTLATFFTGEETPDSDAPPLKVVTFYVAHKTDIERSAILIAIAFLFAVFWSGALAGFLRRTGGGDALPALVVAGAVLMAVGAATLAGVEYGLAHEIHKLGPQTAQTLNILNNQLFLPLIIGGCVYGVASGLAILGGADLPKWLGWLGLLLGVLTAAGPLGFFALLALLVWTLIASIMIYLRCDRGEPAQTAPAAAA